MAFKVKNETRNEKTLNLIGGNSISLYPRGCVDGVGKPLDEATILDEEVECSDVVSFREEGWISVTKIVANAALSSEAQPEAPESAQKRTRR